MTTSCSHGIVLSSLLQGQPLFKVKQLGVDISNCESFLSEEGGDDRIVLLIKAGEDVRDQLVIIDLFACSG
jgi:hypothetical protein